MADDSELKELVERAKAYDVEALAQIYERYFDRVFRYMLARVRKRETAEDLTGQTFLRLLERLSEFEWRGPGFTAWLFRIAHNIAVDWFRRRHEMSSLDAGADISSGRDDSVFDAVSLKEALDAIDGLQENHRQVLLLRLVAGLSGRETAEMLDVSEVNVRTLQHRALIALREKMEVRLDA